MANLQSRDKPSIFELQLVFKVPQEEGLVAGASRMGGKGRVLGGLCA